MREDSQELVHVCLGDWEDGDADRGCPGQAQVFGMKTRSLGGACRKDTQVAKGTGAPTTLIF